MRNLRITLSVNLEEVADFIHDDIIRIIFLNHFVFVKFRYKMISECHAIVFTKLCKILNYFVRDAEYAAVFFKYKRIFHKEVVKLCSVPHIVHRVGRNKTVFIKGKLHIVYLEISENIVKNLGFSIINRELFRFTEHSGSVSTKLRLISIGRSLRFTICRKPLNIFMNL